MLQKLTQVQPCSSRHRHGLDVESASRLFPFLRIQLFQRTIGRAHGCYCNVETKGSKMPYFSQQVAMIDRRELPNQIEQLGTVSHGPTAPPPQRRQSRPLTTCAAASRVLWLREKYLRSRP